MSADVDVAEGGTATSQRRNDPSSDAWSTNDIPLEDPPLRLQGSDFNRLQNLDPYNPGSPESVASNSGSPTEPHSSSTSGSAPPSLPPMPHAESSDGQFLNGHFPSQAGWSESVNSGGVALSTGHQLTPQNLVGGRLPHPGPSEGRPD
jgi:hypothetical protein